MRHKPLDRQLLDRLALSVKESGQVCDMGCGPGQVARYLRGQGAEVCGVDLSLSMIECARRLNPGVEFSQGDMRALNVADRTWAGMAAFYALIHIFREEIVQVLGELRRVLRAGGSLLLAFHVGEGFIHRDEWWGHKVCLDFLLFHPDEMTGDLRAAGFETEETILRDPYPDV